MRVSSTTRYGEPGPLLPALPRDWRFSVPRYWLVLEGPSVNPSCIHYYRYTTLLQFVIVGY
jgi:hypothetical protein